MTTMEKSRRGQKVSGFMEWLGWNVCCVSVAMGLFEILNIIFKFA